jgi:hypothetical protein
VRPSELLNINHGVRAFMIDNAVFVFGRALENELHGVDGKNKKEIERKSDRILRKWLPDSSIGRPRYRDVKAVGSSKRTIQGVVEPGDVIDG